MQRLIKLACTLVLIFCGCATTPYRSKFQCPATYPGRCESLEQTYQDSVYGLDTRLFDPEWVKREREWEKRNAELIKARKKAGEDVKTVEEKLKELKKKDRQDYEYRKKLFHELKQLLSEPEKPVIVPPKVIRVLVLSTLVKEDREREIFISPRYIYFMLDKPRWLLHKEAEKVPWERENPLLKTE